MPHYYVMLVPWYTLLGEGGDLNTAATTVPFWKADLRIHVFQLCDVRSLRAFLAILNPTCSSVESSY